MHFSQPKQEAPGNPGGSPVWRDIPGYPGYQASSTGYIRSLKGKGRVLKDNINKARGYRYVGPVVNGKNVTRDVHFLVALAFIGPSPDSRKIHIRHLNGNKLDCRPANLQYGTRSQNAQDMVTHGNHVYARRSHCQRDHPLEPCPWRPGARYCPVCTRERARKNTAAYRKRRSSIASLKLID